MSPRSRRPDVPAWWREPASSRLLGVPALNGVDLDDVASPASMTELLRGVELPNDSPILTPRPRYPLAPVHGAAAGRRRRAAAPPVFPPHILYECVVGASEEWIG